MSYTTGVLECSNEVIFIVGADAIDGAQTSGVVNGDRKDDWPTN